MNTPPQVEPVSGGEAVAHAFRQLREVARIMGPGVNAATINAAHDILHAALSAPVCDRVAGEGEIEALRRDAERYRTLRNSDAFAVYDLSSVLGTRLAIMGELLDERADAAIASTLAPTALNGGE